jgi:hypothetical protein
MSIKIELEPEKFEVVGNIVVDSGSVAVGDPCSFKEPEDDPIVYGPEENFIARSAFGGTIAGRTVRIATTHGDGKFPVMVQRGPNGRPRYLVIALDEEDLVDEKDALWDRIENEE